MNLKRDSFFRGSQGSVMISASVLMLSGASEFIPVATPVVCGHPAAAHTDRSASPYPQVRANVLARGPQWVLKFVRGARQEQMDGVFW